MAFAFAPWFRSWMARSDFRSLIALISAESSLAWRSCMLMAMVAATARRGIARISQVLRGRLWFNFRARSWERAVGFWLDMSQYSQNGGSFGVGHNGIGGISLLEGLANIPLGEYDSKREAICPSSRRTTRRVSCRRHPIARLRSARRNSRRTPSHGTRWDGRPHRGIVAIHGREGEGLHTRFAPRYNRATNRRRRIGYAPPSI